MYILYIYIMYVYIVSNSAEALFEAIKCFTDPSIRLQLPHDT